MVSADKLNFTFEFTVKELSKIAEEKDKEFWSPEYSVGGLTWKISVGKEIADENDSIPGKINLSVYVHVRSIVQILIFEFFNDFDTRMLGPVCKFLEF